MCVCSHRVANLSCFHIVSHSPEGALGSAVQNSSWGSPEVFSNRYRWCKGEWLIIKGLFLVSSLRSSDNVFWSYSFPAPPRFDTSPSLPTQLAVFFFLLKTHPIQFAPPLLLDVAVCARPVWSHTKQNPSLEGGGGHEERSLSCENVSILGDRKKSKCLLSAEICCHLYVTSKMCYSD